MARNAKKESVSLFTGTISNERKKMKKTSVFLFFFTVPSPQSFIVSSFVVVIVIILCHSLSTVLKYQWCP